MNPTQNLGSSAAADKQRARFLLRFGKRGGMSASVEVTSTGIRSVAILVSGILLSTAVLVGVAKHGRSEGLRRLK